MAETEDLYSVPIRVAIGDVGPRASWALKDLLTHVSAKVSLLLGDYGPCLGTRGGYYDEGRSREEAKVLLNTHRA